MKYNPYSFRLSHEKSTKSKICYFFEICINSKSSIFKNDNELITYNLNSICNDFLKLILNKYQFDFYCFIH